jgi:hypothetical protein
MYVCINLAKNGLGYTLGKFFTNSSGTDVMIFKRFCIFCSNYSYFLKKMIIRLVFEKNANFFRRKLAKIAESCDHNIDPWSLRIGLKYSVHGESHLKAGCTLWTLPGTGGVAAHDVLAVLEGEVPVGQGPVFCVKLKFAPRGKFGLCSELSPYGLPLILEGNVQPFVNPTDEHSFLFTYIEEERGKQKGELLPRFILKS